MKIKINDKKCGASENACKIIGICPAEAISYAEADEPVTDREVNCGSVPDDSSDCACNCSCNQNSNSNDCGGSPYGRIIIDYDKCTGCGLCADECCADAIEMEAE